ncbi:MAG: 2OG-Fe(II) oxygenase [Alphaproteobacteria bacterium]|nr:2OG-Fe(II) oxygenase [Alphaproteobacteria bacterium]
MEISNDTDKKQRAIYSQIYWDNFFSNEEIERIIKNCSDKELQDSTVSSIKPTVESNVRISKVNFHNPNPQNQWIFNRINFGVEDLNSKFFHFDLCGYNFFQYSEYDGAKSGKYDFHMDTFINNESLKAPLMRKLSLTILLSEPGVDFEGGEFQLNLGVSNSAKPVPMRKGSLVAFPSFLLHRVTTVTKGVRRSIAVWVVGPKFR